MGQLPFNQPAIEEHEHQLLLTCLKLAASRLSKAQVLELADMLFEELRSRRTSHGEQPSTWAGPDRRSFTSQL